MGKNEIIKRAHKGGDLTVMRSGGEDKPSRVIRGTAIVLGQPTELYRDSDVVLREVIDPAAVPESLLRESDIKMTLYHNQERLLARSKFGDGSLKWERDDTGVRFEFEAPDTEDGNTALELVERGVIDGCSFWAYARSSDYKEETVRDGDLVIVTRTILRFQSIEDFTLTPSPAYEQTEVERVKRDAHAVMEEMPTVKAPDFTAIERAASGVILDD
ncbi:MAG: HK97 family phage prohead protease [Muribaculaceae bacterium]|nr:HK97 family phage prohead protease [Muribaculaceae bacterium]